MVAAAPWQGEKGHYFLVILGLAPTDDSYGHLNLKWVLDGIVSAFNRVLICETYFGLQERHNLNMSILSSVEKVLFGSCC
jgi:hypothetical protein